MQTVISKPIISADSHITEPGDMFDGRVPKSFIDRVPRMVRKDDGGDAFLIEGNPDLFPITLASGAGLRGEALAARHHAKFMDCHHGGWTPKQRLEDQDLDGIAAEIIYPSLGMLLCNHDDNEYKTVCFNAYNEWLAEFCQTSPSRFIGLGQTVIETPEKGIEDLRKMKALGMKGVMMPGYPQVEDYDSKIYDEFWAACVELDMPISFHILTYKDKLGGSSRGPQVNGFMGIIRGNQDIIGAMIFSGVFDRHPKLKLVCAEADAGWAPHYMYRLNHALESNPWLAGKGKTLERRPSEYFWDNVYLTFQDDYTALLLKDHININRMMWANDFPHLDSTWPNSQALLTTQTAGMTVPEREKLLHDNVSQLYKLDL